MNSSQTADSGIREFAPRSSFTQGRYGRMFRALPPADYGSESETLAAFQAVAAAMSGSHGPNPASGLPAAYTYFGQFIDHDLTFDPTSSLQRQNDPEGLVDFRTPRFDLDSVYGRGQADSLYLYDNRGGVLTGDFLRGQTLNSVEGNPFPFDLPRNTAGTALIGDMRNDENVIVSQLHGLFLRLHNRLRRETHSFDEAQKLLRYHYQWVVIHDWLPAIVNRQTLASVWPAATKPGGQTSRSDWRPNLAFYADYHTEPYMPLEFSAAAFRFGHSMVRDGYRLNSGVAKPLFDPDPNKRDLRGFKPLLVNWAIEWSRFIDLEGANAANLQFAMLIDTSLSDPLAKLPAGIATAPLSSLSMMNFLRGWRLRLPSGQDVARAMGAEVIATRDIRIGEQTFESSVGRPLAVFEDNCPLWLYVLAEAMGYPEPSRVVPSATVNKLGPVGGRIVAETFAALLFHDPNTFINREPNWKPTLAGGSGEFRLRDLIAAATQ